MRLDGHGGQPAVTGSALSGSFLLRGLRIPDHRPDVDHLSAGPDLAGGNLRCPVVVMRGLAEADETLGDQAFPHGPLPVPWQRIPFAFRQVQVTLSEVEDQPAAADGWV